MSPAGPYPTKPMFQRLEQRVNAPLFLGQYEQSARIDPGTPQAQQSVSSLYIEFSGASGGAVFTELLAAVNMTQLHERLSSMTVQTSSGVAYEYSGAGAKPALSEGGYGLEMPFPLPVGAYGSLEMSFSTPVLWTGGAATGAELSPQFSSVTARDSGGAVIASWLPNLELVYPNPVETYGQLFPTNLPVITSSNNMPEGGWGVVVPASGTPYLLYRDRSGDYHHLPLTPGLPQ